MFSKLMTGVRQRLSLWFQTWKWKKRTLVVGPVAPVDGDSVSCTRAMIDHLRKLGLEAYTLPTIAMYAQIQWILTAGHLHPGSLPFASDKLTTPDLQACYDALLLVWRPDEILLVDGAPDRLGFDPRGVPVRVIDHHVDRGTRDDKDAYIQPASCAGSLLIKKFRIYDPILVVAILTDTYWLRQNLPAEAIEALYLLRKKGGLTDATLVEIQQKLKVPGDPRVIDAIRTSKLRRTNEAVFVVLEDKDPELHRGVCGELGYFFKHLCVVRGDGYVSFRTTDLKLDLSKMARDHWHGGGHRNMSAGRLEDLNPDTLAGLYEDFMATVEGRQPALCRC